MWKNLFGIVRAAAVVRDLTVLGIFNRRTQGRCFRLPFRRQRRCLPGHQVSAFERRMRVQRGVNPGPNKVDDGQADKPKNDQGLRRVRRHEDRRQHDCGHDYHERAAGLRSDASAELKLKLPVEPKADAPKRLNYWVFHVRSLHREGLTAPLSRSLQNIASLTDQTLTRIVWPVPRAQAQC